MMTSPITPRFGGAYEVRRNEPITRQGIDNLMDVLLGDLFYGPGIDYILAPRNPADAPGALRRLAGKLPGVKPPKEPTVPTADELRTRYGLAFENGRPTLETLKPNLDNLQWVYETYVGKLPGTLEGNGLFASLERALDDGMMSFFQQAGLYSEEKFEYMSRRNKNYPYDRDNVLNPRLRPDFRVGFDSDDNTGFYLTGADATAYVTDQLPGRIVVDESTSAEGSPVISPRVEEHTDEQRVVGQAELFTRAKRLDLSV